jgi:hypothetical protein
MKRYGTSALQTEREEELEEVCPLNLRLEEELELMPIAEWESAPSRCPPDSPYMVRGFTRYSGDTRVLPDDQFAKFKRIADEINSSLSGAPGAQPVTQVVIVGHADADPARERREPGFLQSISEKRALAALGHLWCKVVVERPGTPDIVWNPVGRGARALAVPNPRTESERKCNRRVEIVLVRSAQPPPRLDQSQRAKVEADSGAGGWVDYYHIALQGTSGQYARPEIAETKAREIAEKVIPFLEQRKRYRDNRGLNCMMNVPGRGWVYDDPTEFISYFKDTLQGTASKFSDPDVVISKAAEIAETTTLGLIQARRKLEWKYASLPQPMGNDCEAGGRVAGGRVNHLVCRPHGHIIDTTTRMVIAHDPEEYKRTFPK